MCKHNKKSGLKRIDPCMRIFIDNLNNLLLEGMKIVACCCGHKKYPMTIVVSAGYGNYDLVSGKEIPRQKKFYKKDKQGYYYIPETIDGTNILDGFGG